jgi:hypothetical protein
MEPRNEIRPEDVERRLDEELAGTFPASDPPSMVQPQRHASRERQEAVPLHPRGGLRGAADAIVRAIRRLRGSGSD